MPIPLLTLQVSSEHDVVRARQRARQIADGLHFDLQAQTKFVTAVSEIVRNAFRYAGGGQVSFTLTQDGAPAVEVQINDNGPGIPDLPAILEGRYQSNTGLGMGIVGARRLMEGMDISSAPGLGTRIRMVKHVPARARAHLTELLPALSQTLGRGLPQDPMGEMQQQNQDLLRTLDELRERQEELKQVNRELEDTNRGVVALHAELDVQAIALRRASQLKTRFLSHMTHEFRTPLNSIHALSDLLLEGTDGQLNTEQHKQVTYILRSCEQLSELVNDLLDLAKVEAGKVTVRPENFSIADLFGALKGALRPLIMQNAAVRLEFDTDGDLPSMYSDQGKIAQILRNLISNAFKFTSRGEVRIAAQATRSDRIRFTVRDTGIGIAPEDTQRVFDEYIQVERAQVNAPRGTGLGLPLSRRLAELLGGTLVVDSQVGVGSLFTLDLPVCYSGSGEMPIVHESNRIPATSPDKPTILLIDDDDVARYLLRSVLPRHADVIETTNGREGLEVIRQRRPHAVFLDLMMSEITGETVLERIQMEPDIAHIPVIIYTSMVIDEPLRRRLSGAKAILSKRTHSREQTSVDVLQALTRAAFPLMQGG
jgi:signal transduction histidine kinase